VPKGSSLNYAAAAINRVSVVVEPFPWWEQILLATKDGFRSLLRTLGAAPPPPPANLSGQTSTQMPPTTKDRRPRFRSFRRGRR